MSAGGDGSVSADTFTWRVTVTQPVSGDNVKHGVSRSRCIFITELVAEVFNKILKGGVVNMIRYMLCIFIVCRSLCLVLFGTLIRMSWSSCGRVWKPGSRLANSTTCCTAGVMRSAKLCQRIERTSVARSVVEVAASSPPLAKNRMISLT